MRLFVAVDIDDATRARVGRAIDALRGETEKAPSAARISWIPSDRLHVTLQFIGEVSEAVTEAITSRLRPAFRVPSFEMRFDRLRTVPASARPRVVWLSIDRGCEELAALNAEVGRRLIDVPVHRDSGAFSPHLTLARFKGGGARTDAERITRVLLQPARGCTIDHVTLYQSRLSPRGPTYTPLLVTRLASPGVGE